MFILKYFSKIEKYYAQQGNNFGNATLGEVCMKSNQNKVKELKKQSNVFDLDKLKACGFGKRFDFLT